MPRFSQPNTLELLSDGISSLRLVTCHSKSFKLPTGGLLTVSQSLLQGAAKPAIRASFREYVVETSGFKAKVRFVKV